MKCFRCHSENVQLQTKPAKSVPLIGFVLILGGLGLMFFSIIGLILGALFGLIVGAIVRAAVSQPDDTIAVCQNCGNSWKVVQPSNANTATPVNPSSTPVTPSAPTTPSAPDVSAPSVPASSSLTIERRNSVTGSVINFLVTIDNKQPIAFPNGSAVSLSLDAGIHHISYAQQGGLGAKKRQGVIQLNAQAGGNYTLLFTFTNTALEIWKSW